MRARGGRIALDGVVIVVAALVVGVAAGLAAVAFRYVIFGVTFGVTGHRIFGDAADATSTHLPALGPWFLLLAPVVGGLVYGPLVYRVAPETRGAGVPDVIEAVSRAGGRIRARVAAVKTVASGVCIGTGGSVGQWGPVVQIGSAVASTIARSLRVPGHQLPVLVAAGAAGGISGMFDAPAAGTIFAIEVILRRVTVQTVSLTAVAAISAAVVARPLLGGGPLLHVPDVGAGPPVAWVLCGVLGVCAAATGRLYVRTIYRVEDTCDRLWRGPDWLRPGVGGLALGALLMALPPLYGLGFAVVQNGIDGGYPLAFVLALLVGKILATSVTLGIGGSGGVFAPSLFIGGMLGTAFGTITQRLLPALGELGPVFGLAGMAAVLAAASHTPIVAVVAVLELTDRYAAAVPLVIAVVVATGVSRLISRDNVYTPALRRRGMEDEAAQRAVPRRRRREDERGAG